MDGKVISASPLVEVLLVALCLSSLKITQVDAVLLTFISSEPMAAQSMHSKMQIISIWNVFNLSLMLNN